MYPEDLRYTRDHEWIRIDGNRGTVGITRYAQEQMGDVVFVELPEVGRELKAGEAFGVVESVKSVSDLYAPVSGRVAEVNPRLRDAPELVNQAPYGDGWMVVIELADVTEQGRLLFASDYRALVGA